MNSATSNKLNTPDNHDTINQPHLASCSQNTRGQPVDVQACENAP
jgi:hypothetical protein